ncbi:hypothetical protein HAX54_049673, partial [Datura stramonium]|nr:hypothetical protein [Datura stramonium]
GSGEGREKREVGFWLGEGGAGGVAPAFCCFPAVKVRREEGRRCSREEKGKGEGAVVAVVVVSPERREEEGGSAGSIAGNYGGCGGGRRRRGCGMVRLRWTVVASGEENWRNKS